MKCIKIILPILAMLIIQQWASAQCTFRILSLEGASFTNQNQTIYGPYANESECERNRQYVLSNLNFSIGNHHVKATASPCSCAGISNSGFSAFGPSQGNSFYSTNAANEISDWSNDDMERMLALDPEYKSVSPKELSMGDANTDLSRSQLRNSATFTIDPNKPFVSTNMREGGSSTIISEDLLPLKERPADIKMVNKYLNQINIDNIPDFPSVDDYIQWIKEKFREVSGFDIDVIVNKKTDLTDEEKQVLANYREYLNSKKVYDGLDNMMAKAEETKVFEMAFLSEFCYGDLDKKALEQTNFKLADIDNEFIIRDKMDEYLKIINILNQNPGFHADLLYNEKTHEYALAFRGSNMSLDAYINPDKASELPDVISDWMKTNKESGLDKSVPFQFQLAAFLAEKLPKGVNITFTGHSLGGALASIAAAISGKPAYTYNSEGVNDKTLEKFGLTNIKKEDFSNIKAYHTSNDLLSNVQDVVGNISNDAVAPRPLGTRIDIGELTTWKETIGVDLATKIASKLGPTGGFAVGAVYGAAMSANKGYEDDGIKGAVSGYAAGFLTGGAGGAVVGTVAKYAPFVIKEGATRGMAHRIIPIVNHFSNLREQKYHVTSYYNEVSKASMRTVQSIQINMQ